MDKTRYQLQQEIRYAECYSARAARLYQRFDTFAAWCGFVGMLGGLVLLAPHLTDVQSVIGAVFVLVAAAQAAMAPSRRAAAHERDRERFERLSADASNLTDQQLYAALQAARVGTAPEIDALRAVAFNQVCDESAPHQPRIKLTPLQRLVAALA